MDSERPLISVVVGAYNEEDSLADTIQSLLGQSFSDYEIIIVDDGSTDKTAEIAKSFEDTRVRLVAIDENIGLPKALNRGIQESEGEYIARADADEYSDPFRLQKQRSVFEANSGVQAVGCWYATIGPDNERVATVQVSQNRDFGVNDLLNNGPGIAHGSVMMQKEAIKRVGGYREEFTLAQDYDLWFRMADEFGEGWLDVVPEVLYERRVEAHQLEKRELQRLFAETARKCAKRRQRGEDDTGLLKELSDRAQEVESRNFNSRVATGMYHYLQGNHLLEQGNHTASRHRALKAIWFAPTKPRPWYLLLLSSLPSEWREAAQNWSQTVFRAR
ncbi:MULTISPECIES: glycosyltransferase family 2 protein [Haloferacaceae]|uniref:glycosyltransferase family 2 protein n=1 Tax=Haloferacaceae TaxID=1644056 RepID=UPI00193AB876|nr:glycosyltransferase family A protein [Halobellus captivus]